MYQHLTKLILARVVAALCAVLAVTTLGATAVVAHSSKVTVHRGSDTHTIEIDSQGNALAPKVRIERVPQSPAETATQANTRMHVTGVSGPAAQPVAGQTLWLTDESGSGLIACHLAWALLNPPWVAGRHGNFVIRCYTEYGEVARPSTTYVSRGRRQSLAASLPSMAIPAPYLRITGH
jgi:hypothetical protein